MHIAITTCNNNNIRDNIKNGINKYIVTYKNCERVFIFIHFEKKERIKTSEKRAVSVR